MKSKFAAALCFVTMVGFYGVGIAGSVAAPNSPVCVEDGFLIGGSVDSELAAEALAPARVPKTGQKLTYGLRDDGQLKKGLPWPNPRFTKRTNGTVKDNLTGLVWLQRANCTVFFSGDTTGYNYRNWTAALDAASRLKSGWCGLKDGSKPGRWRLPNVRELYSLIHAGVFGPALPNTPGTGKWTEGRPFSEVHWEDYEASYWSSTSTPSDPTYQAFAVDFYEGRIDSIWKSSSYYYVWPVRDDL